MACNCNSSRRRQQIYAATACWLSSYVLAMLIWQHRYLVTHSADGTALLTASKDEFLGWRSPGNRNLGAGNNSTARGGVGDNGGVGSAAWSRRPASAILRDPTLPAWVKHYAGWHQRQRRRYLDAQRRNGSAADDVRFLISRCLSLDVCGGAADRLQDMPYNLMLANRTDRVLLVRWEKPTPLETFLVPPAGGIDWRIPDDMWRALLQEEGSEAERAMRKGRALEDEVARKAKIVSSVRDTLAATNFRIYEADVVGHKIYHDVFSLLFSPTTALAERVDMTMNALGLVPRRYSSVHLRVKYPINKVDEQTFTFQKFQQKIRRWADNAVRCAAELQPNATIYVTADDNNTVGYLLEDSPFAPRASQRPAVRLVARDYSRENAHLAFSRAAGPGAFLSAFEDLLIMGLSRCVAHGLGGYGRLGAALSGGECTAAHQNFAGKMKDCALAAVSARRVGVHSA